MRVTFMWRRAASVGEGDATLRSSALNERTLRSGQSRSGCGLRVQGRVHGDLFRNAPQASGQDPVDRPATSTGDQERRVRGEENQRKLHAIVGREEGVRVYQNNGYGHGYHIERGADPGQRAGNQHQAAEELTRAGEEGPEDTGRHPKLALEEASRPGEAVSPEPAEELLRTVGGEDDARSETQRKQRDGTVGVKQF